MARIKLQTAESNEKLADKIDALKIAIKIQKELVTDLALNQLMEGETVEIVDENGVKYDPLWNVKFSKN